MSGSVSEWVYFKTWFVFFLGASVFGAVIGGLVGGVMGAILGFQGASPERIRIVCGIVGFLVGIPISYAMFRWTVGSFIVKRISRAMSGPSA